MLAWHSQIDLDDQKATGSNASTILFEFSLFNSPETDAYSSNAWVGAFFDDACFAHVPGRGRVSINPGFVPSLNRTGPAFLFLCPDD